MAHNTNSADFYEEWRANQIEFLHGWLNTEPAAAISRQEPLSVFTPSGSGIPDVSAGRSSSAQNGTPMNQLLMLYNAWKTMGQSWMSPVNTPFGAFSTELSQHTPKIAQDTFNNLFSVSRTYISLLDFWLPLYKTLKVQPNNRELLQSLVSSQRYRVVLEQAFEFLSPAVLEQFITHTKNFVVALGGTTPQAAERLAMLLTANTEAVKAALASAPDQAHTLYSSLMLNFAQQLSESAATSQKSQLVTAARQLLQNVSDYATAFVQYQQLLYNTGQNTLSQLLHDMLDSPATLQELESYEAFFKQWVAANEQAYQTLFRTDEFIAAQNTLSASSMKLYAAFQRLMELFLEDYPVVVRSQMDALYKAVGELKRDLREYEREHAVASPVAPVPPSNGVQPTKPSSKGVKAANTSARTKKNV